MSERCIGCESSFRVMEFDGDPWCWGCVVTGQYAAFVEAQATVDAIVGERARRAHDIPPPRAVRVKHGPV